MIENLLCLGFISAWFMVLLCVISKSVWYLRASFWVLLHAMFMYDWKHMAQRLKLRQRLLTINKINIIRWNVYRDNNFHSRRQELRVKSLWKSCRESGKHKLINFIKNLADLCFKPLPVVCYFSRWTRGKKIAQSFLFTAKIITKYSSERFFVFNSGQKTSKGFLKFYKPISNLILL